MTVEEYAKTTVVSPWAMRTFGAACARRAINKAKSKGLYINEILTNCIDTAFDFANGEATEDDLVVARGRADSCQCDRQIYWVWHACRATCMVSDESGLEAARDAARFIGMGVAEREANERRFQLGLLKALNDDHRN